MQPAPANIVYYPRTSRLWLALGAGVVLEAIFAWIILRHNVVKFEWYLPALAYVGVPGIFLVMLYWAFRLIRRQPMFAITPEGLVDTSSFVGAGLIHWNEIAQITLRQSQEGAKMKYLVVVPHDIAPILARQRNALAKLNERTGGDVIEVGQLALPLSVEQLQAAIQQYYTANVAPRGGAFIAFTPKMQEVKA